MTDGHVIRARQAAGAEVPRIEQDTDVIVSFLEDAAHFPGGFASGVATPASEGEVAALLRTAEAEQRFAAGRVGFKVRRKGFERG